MVIIKTPEQIAKMRAAGKVVRRVLKETGTAVQPGTTTGELEDIAARIISESGGTSPFLGYAPVGHPPFPAWTCISVNDEIVHGIPSNRVLQNGDIVTVDCGVELDGWIADSAWTYGVGTISPQADRLLKVTEESLYRGIEKARAGNRTGDIGHAVQLYAERNGFSVVRELTGHGVGQVLHEGLQVPNYGARGKGDLLKLGMTFAIEPMLNQGRRDIKYSSDGWTIVTADGKLSAHFEHTVAIVENGVQILTQE